MKKVHERVWTAKASIRIIMASGAFCFAVPAAAQASIIIHPKCTAQAASVASQQATEGSSSGISVYSPSTSSQASVAAPAQAANAGHSTACAQTANQAPGTNGS
jgi:hypothetical protein